MRPSRKEGAIEDAHPIPLVRIRRALIAVSCAAAVLATVLATAGGSAQAGTGPDVTVFSFTDIASYGSANGFAA